jgi:hypothetical protein
MPLSSTSHTTVFRVRGLPPLADNVLTAQLGAFIRQQLLRAENAPFTITCAPNCYDEQREWIALVGFSAVPKFLARLVTSEPHATLTIAAYPYDITFERYFFGFTQLCTPQPHFAMC